MAMEMEVGQRRMYEILGKDNPYPKAKRLIRVIGKFNQRGVRAIKADLDAMFAAILGESDAAEITASMLHKEAFEAVDALLEGKPAVEQLFELRELVAVAQQKIDGIEKLAGRNGLTPVA